MSTLPIDNAKKYTDFDAIAKLEECIRSLSAMAPS